MDLLWQPGMTLDQVERRVIEQALKFYQNNKTRTAQSLGIAIRTLDNKLLIYEGKVTELNPEPEKAPVEPTVQEPKRKRSRVQQND